MTAHQKSSLGGYDYDEIAFLPLQYGHQPGGSHISYDMYKQAEYDKLADVIRANMDMDYIYRVIGL